MKVREITLPSDKLLRNIEIEKVILDALPDKKDELRNKLLSAIEGKEDKELKIQISEKYFNPDIKDIKFQPRAEIKLSIEEAKKPENIKQLDNIFKLVGRGDKYFSIRLSTLLKENPTAKEVSIKLPDYETSPLPQIDRLKEDYDRITKTKSDIENELFRRGMIKRGAVPSDWVSILKHAYMVKPPTDETLLKMKDDELLVHYFDVSKRENTLRYALKELNRYRSFNMPVESAKIILDSIIEAGRLSRSGLISIAATPVFIIDALTSKKDLTFAVNEIADISRKKKTLTDLFYEKLEAPYRTETPTFDAFLAVPVVTITGIADFFLNPVELLTWHYGIRGISLTADLAAKAVAKLPEGLPLLAKLRIAENILYKKGTDLVNELNKYIKLTPQTSEFLRRFYNKISPNEYFNVLKTGTSAIVDRIKKDKDFLNMYIAELSKKHPELTKYVYRSAVVSEEKLKSEIKNIIESLHKKINETPALEHKTVPAPPPEPIKIAPKKPPIEEPLKPPLTKPVKIEIKDAESLEQALKLGNFDDAEKFVFDSITEKVAEPFVGRYFFPYVDIKTKISKAARFFKKYEKRDIILYDDVNKIVSDGIIFYRGEISAEPGARFKEVESIIHNILSSKEYTNLFRNLAKTKYKTDIKFKEQVDRQIEAYFSELSEAFGKITDKMKETIKEFFIEKKTAKDLVAMDVDKRDMKFLFELTDKDVRVEPYFLVGKDNDMGWFFFTSELPQVDHALAVDITVFETLLKKMGIKLTDDVSFFAQPLKNGYILKIIKNGNIQGGLFSLKHRNEFEYVKTLRKYIDYNTSTEVRNVVAEMYIPKKELKVIDFDKVKVSEEARRAAEKIKTFDEFLRFVIENIETRVLGVKRAHKTVKAYHTATGIIYIRGKYFDEVSTLIHETGHHLDTLFDNKLSSMITKDRALFQEGENLIKEIFGAEGYRYYKRKGHLHFETIAEGLARYLANKDEFTSKYPQLGAFFKNIIDDSEYLTYITEILAEHLRYVSGLSNVEKVKYMIGKFEKNKILSFTEDVIQKLFDKFIGFAKMDDKFKADTYRKITTLFLGQDEAIATFLERPFVITYTPQGFNVQLLNIKPLLQIIEDVRKLLGENESDFWNVYLVARRNIKWEALYHNTIAKLKMKVRELAQQLEELKKIPDKETEIKKIEKMIERLKSEIVKKENIITSFKGEIHRKALEELNQKYQQIYNKFEEFANDIYTLNNALLKLVYEAGVISDKTYNRLKSYIFGYVPFRRLFIEKELEAVPVERVEAFIRNSLASKEYYTIEGSVRPLTDIKDAYISNVFHTLKAVYNNYISRILIDEYNKAIANKYYAINKYMFVVPEATYKTLKVKPATFLKGYVAGREYRIILHPDLHRAFQDIKQKHFIANLLSTVNTIQRYFYTNANIFFGISNVLRDLQTAYILGDYKDLYHLLKQYFIGLGKLFKNDDEVYKFLASGGGTSGFFASPTTTLNIIKKSGGNTLFKKIISSPRALAEYLERINSYVEYATRIGYYDRLLKQGMNNIDAVFYARTITADFGMRGTWSDILGLLYLYFNARMQGLRSIAIALKTKPIEATTKMFVAPSLLTFYEFYLGRDDPSFWAIPESQRYYYWHFKVGDSYIKIPKGEVGNIVSTPLTLFLMNLYKDYPIQARHITDYILNISPITNARTIPETLTPTAFRPLVRLFDKQAWYYGAEAFRDAPSVENIYKNVTADLYLNFGIDISPQTLYSLVRGYFGDYGRIALALIEIASAQNKKVAIDDLKRAIMSRYAIMFDNAFRIEYQAIKQIRDVAGEYVRTFTQEKLIEYLREGRISQEQFKKIVKQLPIMEMVFKNFDSIMKRYKEIEKFRIENPKLYRELVKSAVIELDSHYEYLKTIQKIFKEIDKQIK